MASGGDGFGEGPWRHPPPRAQRPQGRPPIPPRLRLALVIGMVGIAAVGAWVLMRLMPGRISTQEDWGDLVRGIGLIALVGSGLLTLREVKISHVVRAVVLWSAAGAALIAGYAYRAPLEAFAQRLATAVVPGYAAPSGAHELTLTQAQDGGYYVNAEVNGRPVIFLVDTGASDIVLSPADARRLGVDLAALKYDHVYETANGVGGGAPYVAQSLTVGGFRVAPAPMSINQAPMRTSLLGMGFFKRLESFHFEDGRLVMRWRG